MQPWVKSVEFQRITAGGALDRVNMIHVQAIAELVNTSRDLLLVSREKESVSRYARTLSNWTRSLRLKEKNAEVGYT